MLHGQRSKVMWCGLIRNTMQTVIALFSKCISVRNLWFLLPGFTIKNNPNPNPVIEMLYIIWFHFVYCRLRISLHNHNVPRDSSVLSFVQVLFSQFCSVLSSVLSSILFLLRTVVHCSLQYIYVMLFILTTSVHHRHRHPLYIKSINLMCIIVYVC